MTAPFARKGQPLMPQHLTADTSIGERLAYWRQRRGKTQTVLAGLSGLSQAYISSIENGSRVVEKRSTLVALASALQVSVAELTGKPGDPTDPMRSRAVAHVPAIREALIRREMGYANGLPALVGDVNSLTHAGQAYDFAAAAPMLPGLLLTCTGIDMVRTCQQGVAVLKYLGYSDLSRDAANLGVTAARDLEDPAWVGVAEVNHVNSLPTELGDVPVTVASRAADEVQSSAGDPRVRQAYGMLHLHAAIRSATNRRPGDALAHLDEAQQAADSLGEPDDQLGLAKLAFGPTNVGIWRLTVLREMGDTERAIEGAKEIVPERIPLASRQAPFYLDLAQALASSGKRDDEAVAAFLRAEAIAPQFVRLRPVVRDTIAAILYRTRRNAVSRPLRRAAEVVGLQGRLH